MPGATFLARAKSGLSACAMALLLSSAAVAQTIDLSLNVFYSNPANANSGGTWELVAKSSHAGIAGLSARITDIASAQNRAPRGTVNGNQPAGFTAFGETVFPQYHSLAIGMAAPTSSGDQSAIYGVGTLVNGAPNYPGRPPGTNAIGPLIPSFSNPLEIPWAVSDPFSDPAWSTAARMASGAFNVGITPSFFPGSSGNVFTNVGTASSFGPIAGATSVSTIIRTNFVQFPDYNGNGKVDAADYVLWRNGGPLMNDVTPGVTPADYDVWRASFGLPPGAGSGAGTSNAVPEPASWWLLVLGTILMFTMFRRHSESLVAFRAVVAVAARPEKVAVNPQTAER